MEAIDQEMTRFPEVRIRIGQIKEKFGGLRFYYQLSNNAPDARDLDSDRQQPDNLPDSILDRLTIFEVPEPGP